MIEILSSWVSFAGHAPFYGATQETKNEEQMRKRMKIAKTPMEEVRQSPS
jgi:hypothetical protein